MPELLALAAALCYSTSSICVQRASRSANTVVGFLTALAVTTAVIVIPAVLVLESWTVDLPTAALFAAAGIGSAGAGRALNMWGVRAVGASVAVPLQASVAPFVATLAGALLFGETVGLARLAAITLILAGVWLCARGGSANLAQQVHRPGRRVVLVPLAAGTAFAAGDILRKGALERDGEPLLGALLGTAVALALWLVAAAWTHRRRAPEPFRPDRSLGWYVLYGLLSAAAQVSIMLALERGELSAVSPLLGTQPVIVLILGAILLRRFEQLRRGTLVGAVIVFAGAAMIAVT